MSIAPTKALPPWDLSPRDHHTYDRLALKHTEWKRVWSPPIDADPRKPVAHNRCGITWSEDSRERLKSMNESNETGFRSMKSMTEIVAGWLSERSRKRLEIRGLYRHGDHIVVGYNRVDIHAFVIYPLGVSLGSESEEERRLSKFVIAEAIVETKQDIKEGKEKAKMVPGKSGALGVEMMIYLNKKSELYDPKARVFPVYDYNRMRDWWDVSVFLPGRDGSAVYHLVKPVDPPWTEFLRAFATSTSSSAERSRTTAASKRARSISPAPARASAVTSSSQPIPKKVKTSAGKNATNSSNAQASTSATLEKESRLMQRVIGNVVEQDRKAAAEETRHHNNSKWQALKLPQKNLRKEPHNSQKREERTPLKETHVMPEDPTARLFKFPDDPKQELYWVNVEREKIAKYKPVPEQEIGESYHRPSGGITYGDFEDGVYHVDMAGNKVAKKAESCDFKPKKISFRKRGPAKCPRCGLTPAQDIEIYGL